MNFKIIIPIILLFAVTTLLADGFIVIPEPVYNPEPFPLEVIYHHVEVEINDQVAKTNIDQSFYNPSSITLEGYYIFPVPESAVLNDFSMFVDGKETPAELLDADKARAIYEDIVRQMKDPALLEYSDQAMFKVRIYPIEPRSEKRVKMSYSEILEVDHNTFQYLYPLNTEKFSAEPLSNVSVKVDLNSKRKLKTIYCPSHEVDVVRKSSHHSIVSYEEDLVKPDRDFILIFSQSEEPIGVSLLTYKETGKDGFFFLSIDPAIDYQETEIIAKDVVFVLDNSGSMSGKKLKQAKKALIYCVENLNRDDRFDIIRFSTEAYALFENLKHPKGENISQAVEFIEELNPVGGTNIEEALNLALSYETKKDRSRIVIFLTDGKPTIGERDDEKLLNKIEEKNQDHFQIFTFGIGYEINTHLLDKITEASKATRSYITPDEDIEIKVSNFFDKVQSPVLTDLKLDYGSVEVYQNYPDQLPDLFKGNNLTLLGRYEGEGKTEITLSGLMQGKDIRFNYPVEFTAGNKTYEFTAPLWASRRIGHLLDLIRLYGESDELRDEIVLLARKFGIITPYTSYLILEDEDTRVVENIIEEEYRTLAGGFADLPENRHKIEQEYDEMGLKSGERSVVVSREFKDLNLAYNIEQTRQGQERMAFVDKEGNQILPETQVRNIQGRAFYQTNIYWVDSELQNQEAENRKRIQFGSKEYFELLYRNKEAADFLALGRNVRFFMDNVFYEIFE